MTLICMENKYSPWFLAMNNSVKAMKFLPFNLSKAMKPFIFNLIVLE